MKTKAHPLLTLIPSFLALLATFKLEEPKYKKEKHNLSTHLIKSSKIIFKSKNLIILLISAFILIGIGDAIHSLKPVFFEFINISLIYFGYIFALSYIISALGHYYSHEVSEIFGNKNTIILSSLFYILFILFATFTNSLLAVALILLGQIFYGIGRPTTEHLMNIETKSQTRATVISGYNFMRHLGIAIFSLLLGYYSEISNINIGFRIGALMMLVIPLIFLLLKNKK